MIPGRSLFSNATGRSSAPEASTACGATIRQKHSRGRFGRAGLCSPTRSSAP